MVARVGARRAKQVEIEKEYGLPFWEVVRGYAEQKESIHATAHILGYTHSAFRRLVRNNGAEAWFVSARESNGAKASIEASKGKDTPAKQRARELARAANPCYRYVTINGITDTIRATAMRTGVPYKTALNRIGRGVPVERAFNPEYLDMSHAAPAHHFWRQSINRHMADKLNSLSEIPVNQAQLVSC